MKKVHAWTRVCELENGQTFFHGSQYWTLSYKDSAAGKCHGTDGIRPIELGYFDGVRAELDFSSDAFFGVRP